MPAKPLATWGMTTAFDMGGPINKVATLFAQTQVGEHPCLWEELYSYLYSTYWNGTYILAPKIFTRWKEAGKAAILMGMIGISEGAIFRCIRSIKSTSIHCWWYGWNIIGFITNKYQSRPWGGWLPSSWRKNRIHHWYLLFGVAVTAIMVNTMKNLYLN